MPLFSVAFVAVVAAMLVSTDAFKFRRGYDLYQGRNLTAESAIECGMKYADIDKDGRLSRREVEIIRDIALGPVGAAGVWLASKVPLLKKQVSVEQIFHDCDYNHDHFITRDDFDHMRATCLNTPGKISDAYVWICDQGDKGVFKNAKL